MGDRNQEGRVIKSEEGEVILVIAKEYRIRENKYF